ncbi:hypothetical protein RFI_07389 [Reticulomyxa filosa]|uniref:Uncharacterized protein n=1 Tax=Reticulomyxa filosa TaxID=46433 RepID=X6NUM9_RETFI|nr:hypothetical protein RFI_07389 [Reticulomyxa filosa]|eukprot:ETO29731.1 hypothetical protein RFI_07389 [Reticulomyxa filosa]
MFSNNVYHCIETSCLTLQNYFDMDLLPQKRSPTKAAPNQDEMALSSMMEKHTSQRTGANTLASNMSATMTKHHASKGNASSQSTNNNFSYLEKIPTPVEVMQRLLSTLKVFKAALDDYATADLESLQKEKGKRPSQKELDNLYIKCRKAIQYTLIHFMYKLLKPTDSLSSTFANRLLEDFLKLLIEYEKILFGYSNEADFFFFGLVNVLSELLPNAVRYGEDTQVSHNSKDKLGYYCINVWNLILMYQSSVLTRFCSKEPELAEKLSWVATKRPSFLQWLRDADVPKSKRLCKTYLEKDGTMLRRVRDTRPIAFVEKKLKAFPTNIHTFNSVVQQLFFIEQARQMSRAHQFYYRDLFSHKKWVELTVSKLRLQSALWLQQVKSPWDETWYFLCCHIAN